MFLLAETCHCFMILEENRAQVMAKRAKHEIIKTHLSPGQCQNWLVHLQGASWSIIKMKYFSQINILVTSQPKGDFVGVFSFAVGESSLLSFR